MFEGGSRALTSRASSADILSALADGTAAACERCDSAVPLFGSLFLPRVVVGDREEAASVPAIMLRYDWMRWRWSMPGHEAREDGTSAAAPSTHLSQVLGPTFSCALRVTCQSIIAPVAPRSAENTQQIDKKGLLRHRA